MKISLPCSGCINFEIRNKERPPCAEVCIEFLRWSEEIEKEEVKDERKRSKKSPTDQINKKTPCVNCNHKWQAEGDCSCSDFCEQLRHYLEVDR